MINNHLISNQDNFRRIFVVRLYHLLEAARMVLLFCFWVLILYLQHILNIFKVIKLY